MIDEVKREIEDYIYQKQISGALLLSGAWGAGKTHLIKEIAQEINQNNKAAVAVVSLFGLDTISAIQQRLKEEYASFYIGKIGKKAHDLKKKTGRVVNDVLSVATIATDKNIAVSSIAKGVSSFLSTSIYDFFEVKNQVKKNGVTLPFILVFDDFERCNNIKIDDKLGIINEYLENKQIKVIIVANEEKINQPQYKEIKEKLISRTIRLDSSFSVAIATTIVDSFDTDSNEYNAFIEKNKPLLISAFQHSGYNNLRSLIACLNDFERIHDVWPESSVSSASLPEMLYKFCAYEYEAKAGHYRKASGFSFYLLQPDGNSENLSDDDKKEAIEKLKSKYIEGTFDSSLSTVQRWAIENHWDKNNFLEELTVRFGNKQYTREERFILYHFWDLEQEDIDQGMPILVKRAYEGKASRDELIALLQKIHWLKVYSITLPCEIDYSKIERGFILRLDRIKKKELMEPKRFHFAEKHEIDKEALPIYERIETFETDMCAWENRTHFVEFINGNLSIRRYDLKNQYIGVFDNELLDLFFSRYNSASNEKKRELAITLLGLDFEHHPENRTSDITINNFKTLIQYLSREYSSMQGATITSAIADNFINNLQDIIKKLEAKP